MVVFYGRNEQGWLYMDFIQAANKLSHNLYEIETDWSYWAVPGTLT